MTRPHVIPIPKSSSTQRTMDNVNARDIALDEEDLALIDELFPAPDRPVPLMTS